MQRTALLVDQHASRRTTLVNTLREHGEDISGAASLPIEKPPGLTLIVLCVPSIVGLETLLESIKKWGCKVIIWCDRLPDEKRMRALIVSHVFNMSRDLVLDVYGPVPMAPDTIVSAYREAIRSLELQQEPD